MKINADELRFIESLYKMSANELKVFFKLIKNNRDALYQKIADILLRYNISNDVMDISKIDKTKLYNDLYSDILNNYDVQAKKQIEVTELILKKVAEEVHEYYWNYNIGFNDVRKIIDMNFKGKHFSTRVWDNESDVAKKLHKQLKDFIDGKTSVNKIKNEIEKTFNTSAYNAERLVETEVARTEDYSFKRFCKETNVKRIKRIAELDNKTCTDCAGDNGIVYDLDKAPELPAHPKCRCYFTIEE